MTSGTGAGVALGLVKASRGPRPRFARITHVDADSFRGELVAGVVLATAEVALVAALAFTGPLWHRLLSIAALLLMANRPGAALALRRRTLTAGGRSLSRLARSEIRWQGPP